jgi:hypothetical protein
MLWTVVVLQSDERGKRLLRLGEFAGKRAVHGAGTVEVAA